jgi:hypothetical protein
MHCPGKVLRRFEFAFYECLVDHDFGGNIGEFEALPGFYLLVHRLKVPLHTVNPD